MNNDLPFAVYRVGGAVRDYYLQQTVQDSDWVVVGATPDQMLALGFKAVGQDFPVFLHPVTREEYALARTERKSGHGYKGFVLNASPMVTLEEDLIRRDLTINAMAEDAKGNLYDPYGGLTDLKARILRHVSPAFSEDPVRILRLARFYARFYAEKFSIAPETKVLVSHMIAAGELNYLTPERIWLEIKKGLLTDYPDQFIACLRELGALKWILPEVDALFGIPQTARYHPEIDTGLHVLLVLQQAVKLDADLATRFACLCHDLGKATTPVEMLPRHIGHEQRSAVLTKSLCERLRVPKAIEDLAVKVARYHLYFHQVPQLRTKTILKLLLALDALRKPDILQQFNIACIADQRGRFEYETTICKQADFLQDCLSALKAIDIKKILYGENVNEYKGLIEKTRLQILDRMRKNYSWT